MTQVHVVTKGDYSDYRIISVFSEDSSILAQKLADSINGEVEIYELDTLVIMPKLQRWNVFMFPDGESLTSIDEDIEYEEDLNLMELRELLATKWKIDTYGKLRMTIECWAKNKTHAIRIANRFRVWLLTLGVFTLAQSMHDSKNFIDEKDVSSIVKAKIEYIDLESSL